MRILKTNVDNPRIKETRAMAGVFAAGGALGSGSVTAVFIIQVGCVLR